MDWSDLPFFLAVARTGQIARAARALGTDPTTAGRRIRRLEQALGERLFEQTPDGQHLTAAGLRLRDQAEAMARIATGIGHRPSPNEPVHGSLRVSVSEGFGTWFISRHLGQFAERHPQVQVELVATSGFLNPSRRETDLAVLLARPRRGPLVTRRLTDYALTLYASEAYLAQHPLPDADALPGHRLIGYIPDILYAPELNYLDELPVPVEPQLLSSSINAQHRMIASGAGVGILPRFIGDADPGLRPVLPDIAIRRSFWLVTHRETREFAAVRAFADWLITLTRREQRLLTGE
ncbi:LysR family transcriptional regulator [Stakelama sediminis]|uniref:DNA-binding transcriptional LysR family regulator n=1 Tax=Stakelama sediminis TaxID=463200 RepID=A0A840Z0C4_9SPHN|nr:LysR family transcriptional regulator [Stakelama sediminis]MBB5719335.1 DNA-binding transcriptional LysR family regulator [Stakelama sediminis]